MEQQPQENEKVKDPLDELEDLYNEMLEINFDGKDPAEKADEAVKLDSPEDA